MENQNGFDKLSSGEKLMISLKMSSRLILSGAVFSDETEFFLSPSNPGFDEFVTIKIRVGREYFRAVIVCVDGEEYIMDRCYSTEFFVYYKATIKPCNHKQNYYFKLVKENRVFFYDKRGLHIARNKNIDYTYAFCIARGFNTPQWAKGAIMYQIFVDRFFNGDKSNDVCSNEYMYLGKPSKFIENWNEKPKIDDIRNFYGGDLKGVMDKMDYLKDLGVEVIYFNPLFVSPSNHKYDTQDYDHIDPHYGVIVDDGGELLREGRMSNLYASKYIKRTTGIKNLEASDNLFIELVEKAHENGIKVILDGVFNHCGAFCKWLDRERIYEKSGLYPVGAYIAKASPYNSYFKWKSENWPENGDYDGWWGYSNHPKLNFEGSDELYNYILSVAKKWVSPPFNADGWRLDVAADLGESAQFNHKFWRDFRKAVKQANPNAIIIAEHYGNPSDWLDGTQWDSVMNYDGFMEPVSYFLTGMEKHSEQFRPDLLNNSDVFIKTLNEAMSSMTINSIQTSMNQLSNHDHSRFYTRTNHTVGRLHTVGAYGADEKLNKGVFKEAILFQMTWQGAPAIYYGDEAGLTGWTDPDNRRTYPWGNEDGELIDFHKELCKIRKKYYQLKNGSTVWLYNEYGIVSYGRFDGENSVVIAINNTDADKTISIPVWKAGVDPKGCMNIIFKSLNNGFSEEYEEVTIVDGNAEITVPSFGGIILVEELK